MPLTLHYHPLSSFCWKALVGLYETNTPFTPHLVDLSHPEQRAEFRKLWPIGQFPVLRDEVRGQTVPQSSVILEYLNLHFAREQPLLPADPGLALQARRWNEFCDTYLHVRMQKIVADSQLSVDKKDTDGVKDARQVMKTAYGVLAAQLQGRTWMLGDQFTMADCAACPALYYGYLVEPFDGHPELMAYLERLKARPSFARVLAEAKPYLVYFPYKHPD